MNQNTVIENATNIFQQASITYFNSAQLFPEEIRNDVSILYSFVRAADDFVDCLPQQRENFYQFKTTFTNILNGQQQSDNPVILSFIDLMNRKQIDPLSPYRFLSAMEQDLTKSTYQTLEELEDYMEGSAEVVGLMMADIMELEKKSHYFARLLGKSMQFINFIRDINHDQSLGRTYIPKEVLDKYQIPSLDADEIKTYSPNFTQLIHDLINLYYEWQLEAEQGYKYIPKEYLLAVKTAADLYKWTAQELYVDPSIIYQKRLKPSEDIILKVIEHNNQSLSSRP